jgi:hypothetical protein
MLKGLQDNSLCMNCSSTAAAVGTLISNCKLACSMPEHTATIPYNQSRLQ